MKKINFRKQPAFIIAAFMVLFVLIFLPAISKKGKVPKGKVERVKVYGEALVGNLIGDSPERDVCVYLPPGYAENPDKKYPVVYFLHGFTDNDAKVYGLEQHWMNLSEVLDGAFTAENKKEVIFVTPDAYTFFAGSMYANSATTGNWEDFVAKELVRYIDSNYRTIANGNSRGLAGHSMGGYGALRIGQKYPHIFSSLYLLSPCCLNSGERNFQEATAREKIEAIETPADLAKADFFTKIIFASAAAWSPNPQKPPFFLDLPIENGKLQPHVLDKWIANKPLVTIDQNIYNIKKLKGIAFDAGNEDKGIAASIKELDKSLDKYGVYHYYEEYKGDHINRVAERMGSTMLDFFGENLEFGE